MAAITQRTWTSRGVNGRRVKHTAWGFTIYRTDGKRVRRYDVAWSREDAEQELARHQLGIVPEAKTAALPTSSFTFGQAVERYLQIKARKRSPEHDRLYLGQLQAALGASTPLVQLTASRISAYKAERLAAINSRTGRPYAAASINRPLAVLRHLLRLAHEEWGELPAMPKVRLEREAEGRTRYLADDEQVRLLQACEASKNPELPLLVTFLLNTGARRGEALGLIWSHVDFARGLVTFVGTKSGKSRSVPMTETCYRALSSLPGEREGRVFKTRSVRTAFERAVGRAGLVDFHMHDCRHSFASQLVMRGVSLQAVKELLGHSSIAKTMRYAHLSPAHLREAVGKLESGISGTTWAQGFVTEVAF